MKRKLETEEFSSLKKAKTTSDNIFDPEAAKREATQEKFIQWTKDCPTPALKNVHVFSKVSIDELREALPNFFSVKSLVNKIRYKNYNQAMEYLLRNLFDDAPYFKKIIQNIDDLIELLEMVHSPQAKPCRQMLYKKLDAEVINLLLIQEPHKKMDLKTCINQIVPSALKDRDTQHPLLSKPKRQLPEVFMQNYEDQPEEVANPTILKLQNQHAFFSPSQVGFIPAPRPVFSQKADSNVSQISFSGNNYYFSPRFFFPNANAANNANKMQNTAPALMAITELTECELDELNRSSASFPTPYNPAS